MKLSSALSRKTFDYKFSDNQFSMLTKKIATGWRREQLEIIWFSCKSEQWIRACGMRIVLESNSNLSVQWPERQQRADDKKRKKKKEKNRRCWRRKIVALRKQTRWNFARPLHFHAVPPLSIGFTRVHVRCTSA